MRIVVMVSCLALVACGDRESSKIGGSNVSQASGSTLRNDGASSDRDRALATMPENVRVRDQFRRDRPVRHTESVVSVEMASVGSDRSRRDRFLAAYRCNISSGMDAPTAARAASALVKTGATPGAGCASGR